MLKLMILVTIAVATNAQCVGREGMDHPAPRPEAHCEEGTWTQWFNLDDPLNGDWCDKESLAAVQDKFPGKVCSNPTAMDVDLAQAQVHPYPWNIDISNNALSCCGHNQILGGMCYICHDYKVRFCCDAVIGECKNTRTTTATWTGWFDVDSPWVLPTPLNDDETVNNIEKKDRLCEKRTAIEARLVSGAPFFAGGNTFTKLSAQDGLLCESLGQECRDYKVQFCCVAPRSIGQTVTDVLVQQHSLGPAPVDG